MRFADFINQNMARKAEKDKNLSRALLLTAEKDLAFFKGIEINENSARKIMTNYYDILRSILESIAALDGYKVYSHEAFTYYLKEKNEGVISIKFDRLRKIRNGINYYGNSISAGEAKEIVEDIQRIICLLKEKYLKNLK